MGADYPALAARLQNVPTGLGDPQPITPPTAAFTSVCVDLTCQFTDTSTDSDGQIVAWAWTFDAAGSRTLANPAFRFAAPGTHTVTLTVTDDDGAPDTTSASVTVTAVLHGGLVAATTKKWTSPSGATNYWSGAVTVAAHGADERPIAGATITAAWTGAVTKTSTCITASNGQCTLQSGTLSYLRSWVTLTGHQRVGAPEHVLRQRQSHAERRGLCRHDEQAVTAYQGRRQKGQGRMNRLTTEGGR